MGHLREQLEPSSGLLGLALDSLLYLPHGCLKGVDSLHDAHVLLQHTHVLASHQLQCGLGLTVRPACCMIHCVLFPNLGSQQELPEGLHVLFEVLK